MGRLRNYLRVHRRRWQLTQEQLAFFFGYAEQSIIARLERDERAIALHVAYGCELLFSARPRDVFSAAIDRVEESLVQRIHALRDRLSQTGAGQNVAVKLQLLHDAMRRIAALSSQQDV